MRPTLTQDGERFGHETGRHGSVRRKSQIDVSPRTRCVVLSSLGSQRGDFPAPWSSRVGTSCTETIVSGVKWVAMPPFELKLGPNESSGRAASVKPPPGAKQAQIRAKIRVKLQGSAAWGQPLKYKGSGYRTSIFRTF